MISRINLIITAGLAFAFFLAGTYLGKVFRQQASPEEVVYARVEEVRHMRRLELVTCYFESMVDVTHSEKLNRSYLLMVIPAKISSYIDLQKMTYTLEDSLIRIYLPDPLLEQPVLDLDSAKLFNLNERYVTASKKSYQTVVKNVQSSLMRAKKDVIQRALANGIKEETTILAEGYFTQLFNGLGLVVCFEALEHEENSLKQ